ncbi:MAG: ribosome assembly RNA-binding protein YhbY [Burkholderiales bacterium]|jgi:putative YhbY family RNA-binding protein|nr:ribosome assembly RNA-binding protein YhbY [Burkholderiales bacterium]
MLTITISERRALRARAHALNPVVIIGQRGLSESVMREIDLALNAHELIKVRVFDDDREKRELLSNDICEGLNCAPVQHIGKLLVLWRPKPDEKPEERATRRRLSKPAKKTVAKKRLPKKPLSKK